MCCVVAFPPSLNLSRLLFVAAIALGTAACSADSGRFSEAYNPGKRPNGEVTGSAIAQPSPPAISSTSLPPLAAAPQTMQSAPLPQPQPQLAQTPPPPAPAIVKSEPKKPIERAATAKTSYTVASGDTLHKIAHRYQVSVADLAAANKRDRHAKLKVGEQLVIPAVGAAQAAPQKSIVTARSGASEKPAPPAPKEKNPPPLGANTLTPVPPTGVESKDVVVPTLSFRRPVNGRVISGFGPKPDGTENLGVNFSVPEGTPIKAAEDGVVAYASNELKSFGNLVMIRHNNGYVTTYAHASEILVKRDEVVKRGQVIAKSGQTGTVKGGPQLHFEIRKGATPVDPMPFLERGSS
jgi:murein DD-endopeptidase MepM/ murein hydrolase activator NlpD